MPVSNSHSFPPRYNKPPGTHPESTAHHSQSFRFRTRDFDNFFDFLPPEKKAFAHQHFPKNSTGTWMEANPKQINEFIQHLDPNERMTFHRRMEEHRPFVSNPSTSGTRPQPQGPTPEPPPHGFGFTPEPPPHTSGFTPEPGYTHAPGFTPTQASERPDQPGKTEEHAHSNPANPAKPGGSEATPGQDTNKRYMSIAKKVCFAVLGATGATWLLSKFMDGFDNDDHGHGSTPAYY